MTHLSISQCDKLRDELIRVYDEMCDGRTAYLARMLNKAAKARVTTSAVGERILEITSFRGADPIQLAVDDIVSGSSIEDLAGMIAVFAAHLKSKADQTSMISHSDGLKEAASVMGDVRSDIIGALERWSN